jgi:hypothetical protein
MGLRSGLPCRSLRPRSVLGADGAIVSPTGVAGVLGVPRAEARVHAVRRDRVGGPAAPRWPASNGAAVAGADNAGAAASMEAMGRNRDRSYPAC